MAPPQITEDYYVILEVEQTASLELITRSYKRLALKLHPDRNTKHDATKAFQLLGQAYETLKDESKRREYDLIYPFIALKRTSSQNTQTPRSPPTSASQPGLASEAAQIAALQKSKEDRAARWQTRKDAFDSSIFELKRGVRRVEQEIKNLESILAAEAAIEARKNSWQTWVMSPIYKKAEESEEQKARKDRERQERRIEKDMKERRLNVMQANLKTKEDLLRTSKEEVDAADLCDDGKIRVIQNKILMREKRQRQEREKMEKERKAEELRQQQVQRDKRAREAAELLKKQQEERRAEEQKRYEKATREREKREQEMAEMLKKQRAEAQKRYEKVAREQQRIIEENIKRNREQQRIIEENIRRNREQHTSFDFTEWTTYQKSTPTCRHDGWWPKVQDRTACPECSEIWTYLLQCPGCSRKACPKCQAAIRPRVPRNTARTNRRAPPRVRTPSPDYGYDWD